MLFGTSARSRLRVGPRSLLSAAGCADCLPLATPAIGGGFIDIHDNQIIILADSAERADEIDAARAEAARERAAELLKNPPSDKEQLVALETALRRSHVRINLSRRRSGNRSSSQSESH